MPQDVQQAQIPKNDWKYEPRYNSLRRLPPHKEDICQAVRLLSGAKRPVILCGLGAVTSEAEIDVGQLSNQLGAPIATSLYAAGFCAKHPLFMGISGGLGSELTLEVLVNSDVMIVIGASLNEWTSHFGKILENGKQVIQIDNRVEAFGWFARTDLGRTAERFSNSEKA